MYKRVRKNSFISLLVILSITACQHVPSKAFLQANTPAHSDRSLLTHQPFLLQSLSVKARLAFTQNDESKAQKVLENNFTLQPSEWIYDLKAAVITVTPTKTYVLGHQDCRDYQARATIQHRVYMSRGTACRQQNGHWQVFTVQKGAS